METWICGGCEQPTSITHWYTKRDGTMGHALPDEEKVDAALPGQEFPEQNMQSAEPVQPTGEK